MRRRMESKNLFPHTLSIRQSHARKVKTLPPDWKRKDMTAASLYLGSGANDLGRSPE